MDRRERAYAKSIRRADFAGARIERILVMDELRETIRFAAMKEDGTFFFAPLDVAEDELLVLIGDAIAARVFSSGFTRELRLILGVQMAEPKQKTIDEMTETERLRYWQSLIANDPVFNGYHVVAEGTNDTATKEKLGISLIKKPKAS